ncbi:hypothetical protein C2E23DRAFT_902766 [Lenzites betulinus]|nr:hypothetical protein C2E23DRAFT_902766 [Lenzites betulinus]
MRTMSSVPTLTAIASIVLTYISLSAYSQNTTASCQSGYEWMNNALGQSPCAVSSWLLKPCSSSNGGFIAGLADPYSYYSFDPPTPCICNSVFFDTLYACATCQGAEIGIKTWDDFSADCNQTSLSAYPEDVPDGTSIPAWAYIDPTVIGRLDLPGAKQMAEDHDPDSTASGSYVPEATSGSKAPASGGTGSSAGPSAASGSKHKSNVALIGGVVGGVVGAILIGGAVFYVIRRRRRQSYRSMRAARGTTDKYHFNMSTYVSPPSETPVAYAARWVTLS